MLLELTNALVVVLVLLSKASVVFATETQIKSGDINEIVKVLANHSTVKRKWRKLWLELGLDVEDLMELPRMSPIEILVHTISCWKSKFSSEATIEALVCVLRKLQHNSAADDICRIYNIQSSSLLSLYATNGSNGDQNPIAVRTKKRQVSLKWVLVGMIFLCFSLNFIVLLPLSYYLAKPSLPTPHLKDRQAWKKHDSSALSPPPIFTSNYNVLGQSEEFETYNELQSNLNRLTSLGSIILRLEILQVQNWRLKYHGNNLTVTGYFTTGQLLETLRIFSSATKSLSFLKPRPTECPESLKPQQTETLRFPVLENLATTSVYPCEESFRLIQHDISAPLLTHMRLLSEGTVNLSKFVNICVYEDDDSFLTTKFCTKFPNLKVFENDMIWNPNEVLENTGCNAITNLKLHILVCT